LEVDGAPQSAYNGWRLYTFGSDTSVGDVLGEGATAAQGTWRSPCWILGP